jgi:hypothetical protein
MLSVSMHLSVGSHWTIVEAAIRRGSAIALVLLRNDNSNDEARSRLDVGKLVFLDPLPVDVGPEFIWQVADTIGRQQREDASRSSSPHY